jgi:hypothetical protein
MREIQPHKFVVTKGAPASGPAHTDYSSQRAVPEAGAPTDALEFVCEFSSKPLTEVPLNFDLALSATRKHWNKFWSTGGAIDLSGSKDPRWFELERRIVLSQYLTAIQCAGSLPPQETGLTYNSWEGKFHLEMHWWHAAHFALWNRLPLLEKSLGYYERILPRAQATAKRQGYTGARWPKMTGPTGAESPSSVGPFLVWQQPHPIFYAELCFREHHDRATLEKFKDVVMEMAVDNWRGLGIYRSDDLLTWTRQPRNLLEQPGTGPDDQVKGGHPDVVVSGERAFLFYFTHPGRRGGGERKDAYEQRRSSIQVVELEFNERV